MKVYTLRRGGGPDLTFEGEVVASCISSPDKADPDFSGMVGRWQVFALYHTKGGNRGCQRVSNSSRPGEYVLEKVVAVDSMQEIFDFFGMGWLAKRLYARAGIAVPAEVLG